MGHVARHRFGSLSPRHPRLPLLAVAIDVQMDSEVVESVTELSRESLRVSSIDVLQSCMRVIGTPWGPKFQLEHPQTGPEPPGTGPETANHVVSYFHLEAAGHICRPLPFPSPGASFRSRRPTIRLQLSPPIKRSTVTSSSPLPRHASVEWPYIVVKEYLCARHRGPQSSTAPPQNARLTEAKTSWNYARIFHPHT